jgi:hypothetical protein
MEIVTSLDEESKSLEKQKLGETCMCMASDLLDEENKELGFTNTWIVLW